jgi:hypothetical protein
MKFPRFGSRSTRARKATGQDRLSRRRQLLPEALEPRLMMAVLNGTTETIPILSLSGPTSAVISAQDSTAPQQTVTVSSAALDALRNASQQGAPTQGAPTQGAPTQGAPTQGAPTQGAPTQGAPTQGAPTQGAATQGAATQGAPAQGGAAQGGQINARQTVEIISSERIYGYVKPKWFGDTIAAQSSVLFLKVNDPANVADFVLKFRTVYLSNGTDGKLLKDEPFDLFKDLISGKQPDAYALLVKALEAVAFPGAKRNLLFFEVHEFWMTKVRVTIQGPGNQVTTTDQVIITGVNYNVDLRDANKTTGEGILINSNGKDIPDLKQANELFNVDSRKIARNFDVPPGNNGDAGKNISDIQTIVAKEYETNP